MLYAANKPHLLQFLATRFLGSLLIATSLYKRLLVFPKKQAYFLGDPIIQLRVRFVHSARFFSRPNKGL